MYKPFQRVSDKKYFLYFMEIHLHTLWTVEETPKNTFKLVIFIVSKTSLIIYFKEQSFPNVSISKGTNLCKFRNKDSKMTLYLWEVRNKHII